VSQARSGANGRSRKRFCGLAVRHGAPRCPPVAGHRTRASLSAQSSRGNRAVSTRAGTGLPRSPRWREHGTQVREAASCRSNSCCGGGRAGAIGGARDGRPTPFRYHGIRNFRFVGRSFWETRVQGKARVQGNQGSVESQSSEPGSSPGQGSGKAYLCRPVLQVFTLWASSRPLLQACWGRPRSNN